MWAARFLAKSPAVDSSSCGAICIFVSRSGSRRAGARAHLVFLLLLRECDFVYDSHDRDSGRFSPGQDDPVTAVQALMLPLFGGSDLACCCSLALLACELSGGLRCRIELTGDRSGAAEDPEASRRTASVEGGPGWHRIPVRAPGARGVPEAWLVVERHDGEGPPPDLDRLSPLATLAGLALARHRLAREARRARRDAKEIRKVIGHALRGHLHTALLRADNLLLGLPEDGEPDVARIREQLEGLKATVLRTVEEIREVVDAPDAPGEPSLRSAAEPGGNLRIPELLREAAEREGAGEAAPPVDVEGQIPDVRADPRQLGPALEELFELARRSRSTSTLSVRSESSPPAARIDLSVELDPFTGDGGDPDEPEAHTGASPAGAGPDGPDGPNGEEREGDRPSLRDVVDRLGGQLRVEADDRTRATVVVILPAGQGD